MANRIVIDEQLCKGCGLCTVACPHNLIEMSSELNKHGFLPAEISADAMLRCTGCTFCAQVCPDVAIEVYREKKS